MALQSDPAQRRLQICSAIAQMFSRLSHSGDVSGTMRRERLTDHRHAASLS